MNVPSMIELYIVQKRYGFNTPLSYTGDGVPELITGDCEARTHAPVADCIVCPVAMFPITEPDMESHSVSSVFPTLLLDPTSGCNTNNGVMFGMSVLSFINMPFATAVKFNCTY